VFIIYPECKVLVEGQFEHQRLGNGVDEQIGYILVDLGNGYCDDMADNLHTLHKIRVSSPISNDTSLAQNNRFT